MPEQLPPVLNNILPSYSCIFAGNLPHLNFSGIDQTTGMAFSLKATVDTTQTTLLSETIYPNALGNAVVKIRSVVEAFLQHQLPTSDDFLQYQAAVILSVNWDDEPTYLLWVVKGMLDITTDPQTYDFETYFKQNLLTWMPYQRSVKKNEPLFVNYFNTGRGVTPPSRRLYMKYFYFTVVGLSASTEQAIYSIMSLDKLYTFNVSFEKLHSLISPAKENVFAIDVYVKDTAANTVISSVHRFMLQDDFNEFDDVFAYSNSIGGFETIRFTGQLSEQENHNPNSYVDSDNQLIEFETTPERIYQKHTGYFDTEDARLWLREFFTSSFRFHVRYTASTVAYSRISIIEAKPESIKHQINSLVFSFKYALQTAAQLFTRHSLREIDLDDVIPYESVIENNYSNE